MKKFLSVLIVLAALVGVSAAGISGYDALTVVGGILTGTGSGAAPAYSFTSDTDTGMWLNGTDVTLSHSNSAKIRYNSTIAYFENLSLGVLFNCNPSIPDDRRLGFGTAGYGDDAWMQGETTGSLSNSSANTVFSISSANGGRIGLTIHYTVECSDGSEQQSASGVVVIAAVDVVGGVTADVNLVNEASACSGGSTLSTSWALDTTDDGSLEVQVTPTSSLTPTTLQIRWNVISTMTTSRSLTVP